MKMTSRMTKLFNVIIRECRHGRRLRHFSRYVRYRLEQYERKVRKQIVSRKSDDYYTPLFYACETGNTKMVEYLISMCGADVDQTGLYDIAEFGSTPLQNACWDVQNYRFEVVECLVKHGAVINRADAFLDRTCLMAASLLGNLKLCEFLLNNGANVDARDIHNQTALHYAMEYHRLDTVKLLLDYGADVTLRSLENDDALQTACLIESQPIINYLVEHAPYSPGRLADANELMGVCCDGGTETRMKYWRKAIEIRNSNTVDGNPLAKTPSMPKRDCYRNASEFTTLDELNAIALDSDALTIQNLLIRERIFGEHKRTFEALERTGAWYALDLRDNTTFSFDSWRYCFDYGKRAVEIGAANNSISRYNVADVAKGLVRALYNLHRRITALEVADPNRVNTEQSLFADVVAIFKLLTSHLIVTAQPPTEKLLGMCSANRRDYDAILKCIAYLIDLLVRTAKTSEAKDEVRALVRHLVNRNPISPQNHETLLHLCVSSDNTIDSRYFRTNYDYHLRAFPDLKVTKLLLECEADVNARNEDGKTPLHIVASCSWTFNQLGELLLDHGAHLDTPDKSGSTPAHELSAKPQNTVDLVNYMTLRCLAAQAIVKYEIQCNNLPASVKQFLDLHR